MTLRDRCEVCSADCLAGPGGLITAADILQKWFMLIQISLLNADELCL
jgi:hypothetical protein